MDFGFWAKNGVEMKRFTKMFLCMVCGRFLIFQGFIVVLWCPSGCLIVHFCIFLFDFMGQKYGKMAKYCYKSSMILEEFWCGRILAKIC